MLMTAIHGFIFCTLNCIYKQLTDGSKLTNHEFCYVTEFWLQTFNDEHIYMYVFVESKHNLLISMTGNEQC